MVERAAWPTAETMQTLEERAEHADRSPEEQIAALIAACRGAMRLIALREDRERVMSFVDPLPESTQRALARLRREYRATQKRRMRDAPGEPTPDP